MAPDGYDARSHTPAPMTTPSQSAPPGMSSAVAAFLRGVERRAAAFAQWQSGDIETGDALDRQFHLTIAQLGGNEGGGLGEVEFQLRHPVQRPAPLGHFGGKGGDTVQYGHVWTSL